MKAPAKFQIRKAMLGFAVAALAGTANAAVAVWDGSLPAAGNPLTSQQYQDFTIYSLNYLDNLSAGPLGASLGLTSPTYNVASSKGQITEYVVIATNGPPAETNTDTCGGTTASSGCDNAYYSNVTGTSHETYFSSFMEPDPSVVVSGEALRSTWTAKVGALDAFLGLGSMVFMFNLNEDNGGAVNTLDGQSLLVSMRVQLTNALGVVQNTFYVGANNNVAPLGSAAAAWAFGAPNPDPLIANTTVLNTNSTAGYISTDARWAYVHGAISVDATTGVFRGMGDCNYAIASGFIPAGTTCKTISQNLGANEVAFAAFNQTLSDLVTGGLHNDWFMNVDIVTAGQSNGHEQLFIVSSKSTFYEVPEPGSLALAGLALAAFGVIRRRRPSTKA